MSWKIRGFSSIDMTSQTQIFIYLFIYLLIFKGGQPGVMTQTCNSSSPEVEGGVQGHSGLHSDVKATMRYMQTNKQKKRGGMQTWGYCRSTSLNKKRMFQGNQ